MYRLVVLIVLSALVFMGCATTNSQSAEEVSVNQVLNPSMWNRAPLEREGTVVVVKDSQLTGIACTYDVLIDGLDVAKLDNGQKVTLRLLEGQYVISALMGKDSCGHGYAEHKVQVKKGGKQVLLIELGSFDGLSLKPHQ